MNGGAYEQPGVRRRSWQRALLPGAVRDPDGQARTARDWIVDVTLALIAIGVGALALGTTLNDHGEAATIIDVALGVVAWAGLWVRRRHPFALAVVTALAGIVSGAAAGPAAVALFNAALRCSRREIALVTAIDLVSAAVFPVLYPGEGPYLLELVVGVLLTLVLVGWGTVERARRDTLLSLEERAARLEAEQELQIELARTGERQRIAREMHDVLAHRISLLAVHAGALEYRHRDSAEEAAAARVIRDSASVALQELREVIGVLREGDRNAEGPEPPQPTVTDIPALVAESRAAGMRVRASIAMPTGDVGVPPLVGRTAYRLVQEGLTNARKHAPAATVDLNIATDDALTVEIISRCPVAAPGPAAGARNSAGLLGLGERVALVGGTLEHGPDAGGDFHLRATLPL